MTVPRMQKPREQMQGQFFMGEVKKKKTKGTKGVGQNENADTKKQTLFQLNDNRGEKHGQAPKYRKNKRMSEVPKMNTSTGTKGQLERT